MMMRLLPLNYKAFCDTMGTLVLPLAEGVVLHSAGHIMGLITVKINDTYSKQGETHAVCPDKGQITSMMSYGVTKLLFSSSAIIDVALEK